MSANPILHTPPAERLWQIDASHRSSMRVVGGILLVLALGELFAWAFPGIADARSVSYYLPLHMLLETMSVVVTMMVFAQGWHSKVARIAGSEVLFASMYFAVGCLDFLHAASYGGMPDLLSHNDAEKPLYFWLAARFVAALGLLVASIRPWERMLRDGAQWAIFSALAAMTLGWFWLVVEHQHWLPTLFVPGAGLTPLKKDLEFLFIGMNLASAVLLYRRMRGPLTFAAPLLFGAACTMAMSDFYFTIYTTMTGTYNVLGHLYKVAGYFFLYRALVVQLIERPYRDLQRARQELEAARFDLQTTLDAVPSLIGHWNHDLICTFANRAYHDWFGVDHGSLPGRHISKVLGEDLFEKNRPYIDAVLRGEAQTFERAINEPGADTVRQSLARYLPDIRGGRVLGFYVLVFDVTTLKQVQQELETVNRTLEERTRQSEAANLAKSRFVANMSHEIRTPMNAVMGLSYLLSRTRLSAEQSELLEQLRVAGRALLVNVNDVLDLSKIEAGEVRLDPVAFRPRESIGELARVILGQAAEKGVKWRVDFAADVPEVLEGDITKLNQILANLMTNAVKFTNRGEVSLHVSCDAARDREVALRFEVADSGVGIAPEVEEKLFEPFTQADESTTRLYGGTGLGLSIVKRLVTLMGGEVALRSAPGAGSRFTVTLRLLRATVEAPGVGQPQRDDNEQLGLAGVRLVVVDDNQINLSVARCILELEGAHVTLARGGQVAVDLLRQQPGAFDIVLMDVQMPGMDGHTATRLIREELGLTDLPVIALTAGAMPSDRQLAIGSGMTDVLTKPFEAADLVRCIRRHLPMPTLPIEPFRPALTSGLAWPQIEGLDTVAAHHRLGSDLDLFATLLRQLLAEFRGAFADVHDVPSDTAARNGLMAMLHKLKGSAGLLGALELHRLSGELESALRQGGRDVDTPAAYARLRASLAALEAESAPWLTDQLAARVRSLANAEEPGTLDPAALALLKLALRDRNISALELFRNLAPALRPQLGPERFDIAQAHMDGLEFASVLELLE